MNSDCIKEVSQGRCHTETWIKDKITILCIADNETISQTLKDLSQPWHSIQSRALGRSENPGG